MKRILFPILLIALAGCSQKKPAQAPELTAATPDSAKIDTTSTDSTTVDGTTSATSKPNEVLFNGTIVLPPQRHATVSLTMGGIVKRTNIIPGQFVGRGSIVAVIENPEFISMQQTYLDCHAQVEYLKAEYERQRILAQQQAASQKTSQRSKAEYLSMKSRLQATATQLSLLGISPASVLSRGIQPYMRIKSPISGYISNVSMNIGKYMHTGDPLCDIIDKSAPMLKLTTYEKDITKMKTGNTIQFRVSGMGDKIFKAIIISVGQNVDETSRSLEVYAKILSSNVQFRPGMYVTARLEHLI